LEYGEDTRIPPLSFTDEKLNSLTTLASALPPGGARWLSADGRSGWSQQIVSS